MSACHGLNKKNPHQNQQTQITQSQSTRKMHIQNSQNASSALLQVVELPPRGLKISKEEY
jgi:hypothetical protein